MSFVVQHGLVLSLLMAMPVLLGGCALLVAAQRRYEVAIVMMLASPWVHWIFASNEEVASVAEAGAETGPGTYLRILLVVAIGGIGYVRFLQARKEHGERLPPRFVFLGLFLAGALASAVYSIAREFTVIRATESLAFLGFLLGLYAWLKDLKNLETALRLLTATVAVGILFNVASIGIAPGRAWWWEAPHRLQGLTTHPNEVGMLCMVAYPMLMWRYRHSSLGGKGVVAFLFSCAIGIHLLSGSRSPFLCATVGFLLWHWELGQRMKLAVLLVGVGIGAVFISSSTLPSLQREESDEVTDLTGRQEFWVHGAEVVKHKPLIGYGYQVSGQVWSDPRFATALLESSWSSARASLHNGYLDTLIGLGFVGLGAWLIILFAPLAALWGVPSGEYRTVCLVSTVQLLMLNCVETVITNSRSFGSIAFWFFWVLSGSLPLLAARAGGVEGGVEPAVPMRRPMDHQPAMTAAG